MSSRPLVVKQNGTELVFPVSVELWPVAEHVKEIISVSGLSDEITEIELTLRVLEVGLNLVDDEAIVGTLQFITMIFSQFQDRYLKSNEIHTALRDIESQRRHIAIRTFFKTISAITKKSTESSGFLIKSHESALFSAASLGKSSIFAIFGGQGNVEDYFNELIALYNTYEPIARPFVAQAAVTLTKHSSSEDARKVHARKIQVIDWLQKPETRPSTETLLIASLSLPLI
ncbi:beta subunit of fatty acid synthetase, partial [Nowakowskiella sp. JEL0078]